MRAPANPRRRRGCLIPLIIVPVLLLGSCQALGPVVVGILKYGVPAATIAKDVLDIDISLSQDKPDKTPIIPKP